MTLINDNEQLVSAVRNEIQIPVYDDGFGPLWIHRDSMGITAIVRAQTWEDAYKICEDEFFPAADSDGYDIPEESDERSEREIAIWNENYGFRNNGRKEEDGSISTIYQKDLNGDWLDPLTPELMAELEIELNIISEE